MTQDGRERRGIQGREETGKAQADTDSHRQTQADIRRHTQSVTSTHRQSQTQAVIVTVAGGSTHNACAVGSPCRVVTMDRLPLAGSPEVMNR